MVNNYIAKDESNERIPLIVSIILCLLSLIPIIVLLVTQLKYKKKKIMFFCFENIFEFRGHSWKRIDYNKYRTDLLKNFDYMTLEDE